MKTSWDIDTKQILSFIFCILVAPILSVLVYWPITNMIIDTVTDNNTRDFWPDTLGFLSFTLVGIIAPVMTVPTAYFLLFSLLNGAEKLVYRKNLKQVELNSFIKEVRTK